MKNILMALLLFAAAIPCYAQADASSQLYKDVVALDKIIFDAYNNCDIENFKKHFTDDLEFYHDKGGVTLGAEALAASVKNNLCSKPGWRLRRDVVPASVKVYPMDNFGAIITGEHLFYEVENGKEKLVGRALFTHLCQYKDKTWKVTRVLSYNHGSPK